MIPNIRVCSNCVMDETAAGIEFDDNDVCNYCRDYVAIHEKYVGSDPVAREQRLAVLVERIRADGRGKPYDCIVGVSGGVDSSYTLVKAKELGLRPLAVHMDNGWNSELAQNNIANLIQKLDVDLYTHVIDWPEYRGLMEAFFASDVIDIELLYDNAMLAVNYRQAAKYGIRYILAGTNVSTEGMRMPNNWNWSKYDARNIRAISRQHGGPKLKTFPSISTMDFARFVFLNRIRWISFLDLFDFRKNEALALLTEHYGYKPYAQKHYESVFTRFYQGYILPRKFNIDKRKLHWSTLVASRQETRAKALEAVAGLTYPSERDIRADEEYFIKKMGWTQEKLDAYIARPERPHTAYPSERALWDRLQGLYRKHLGGAVRK